MNDMPCTKLDKVIHITKSGKECLCGVKWEYGYEEKDNVLWRKLDSVTCDRCKELYKQNGLKFKIHF